MKKIMFNDRFGLTEAVIEKRKTVTRRLVKPPQWSKGIIIDSCGKLVAYGDDEDVDYINPPYKVGEIVAVAQSYREAYNPPLLDENGNHYVMGNMLKGWNDKRCVCAELMPHQIRILNVRAERLQDITDEDCLSEGIYKASIGYYIKGLIANWEKESHTEHEDGKCYKLFPMPKEAYASLIDKISGKGTWNANPWVWRIEFELIK